MDITKTLPVLDHNELREDYENYFTKLYSVLLITSPLSNNGLDTGNSYDAKFFT